MLVNFKLSLLIFLWLLYCEIGRSSPPTSGPFKSYLTSVRKCEKPTYPYHPNPTITLYAEVYNSTEGSMMRGSYDVLNYTTNVKIKVKSMIWEKEKWKRNFVLVDNMCRGSIIPFWMSLFKVKFDKKKCAFLECHIPFDNVNINKLHHMMTSTFEYGRILFTSELFLMGKQYRTFYCHEFESIVEPI